MIQLRLWWLQLQQWISWPNQTLSRAQHSNHLLILGILFKLTRQAMISHSEWEITRCFLDIQVGCSLFTVGLSQHLPRALVGERKLKQNWILHNLGVSNSTSRDWLPKSESVCYWMLIGKRRQRHISPGY